MDKTQKENHFKEYTLDSIFKNKKNPNHRNSSTISTVNDTDRVYFNKSFLEHSQLL